MGASEINITKHVQIFVATLSTCSLRPCGDAGSLDVSAGVLWSQVVSVIRGFEVRRGQSSPIETEVRRKKGAWIRKMEMNTKATSGKLQGLHSGLLWLEKV